jgi:uncharacterized protein YcbK (DUF882 family)
MAITMEEILKDAKLENQEKYIQDNLKKLLEKLNIFRAKYAKPLIITSGLRTKDDQRRIYKEKAAKKQFPFENGIYDENKVPMKSKHIEGLAVDFSDPDGALKKWVLDNMAFCEKEGFYFEDFETTKNWLHIQIVPPLSGKRIFKP